MKTFAHAAIVALSLVALTPPAMARTLVLAGDSTLDEHGGDESVYGSWGANLRPYLLSGNSIVNYGRGGRSTSSFIREGWWDLVLAAAGEGDFVLVQFGHNDQKLDDASVATPIPQFRTNLVTMAAAVRAKGATPVFATPIVRLNYSGGRIADSGLDQWAAAMREVAADEGVALVDMREMTRQLANDAGEAEALTWYVDGDHTHPAPKGARLYAELFIDDVLSRGLPVAAIFSADAASGDDDPVPLAANEYEVYVPFGQTRTIDAALVAAIGTNNLVKTGRGSLRSSEAMADYAGEITVRAGSLAVTTASDLGTGDGGTTVESGATLVVDMSASSQRFSNEAVTIAGEGDAMHHAAVWQSSAGNDQFKLFKYLVLSADATIFAGTRLGVDNGTLTMNGHTLTVKGANFALRNMTYQAVGNVVAEANMQFMAGQSPNDGAASATFTVRNGGKANLSDSTFSWTPSCWTLIVEEGGKIQSSTTATHSWHGDVIWNATIENGATGLLSFPSDVTGTGTIKSSSGTLTFAKPLGAGVGLGLSGTATAILPPDSYTHKGLMTGMRTDGWTQGYNTDRGDTRWSYCAYGPGPQLVRDGYWEEDDPHSNGKARMWCSRGYLWNREATNVTYTIFAGSVYQNWIYLDGDYGTAVYDNKRDQWGSCTITVPAQSCRQIDIRTSDGKSYGGPRTDSDKFKINGVIANDPTGRYFTTNAVSTLVASPALPTLALAGDGALDANNTHVTVSNLVGGAAVSNAKALTISDSWTLAAADIVGGDALNVDGALVFDADCAFAVTDLSLLSVSSTYTIATAGSITGFADGTEVSDGDYVWRFNLSGDGKSITAENVRSPVEEYVVFVPYGQTNTIDAAFVAALGSKNLVKMGRGTLVSSTAMANYTGTIIIREGAFLIRTTDDLGTSDGGTVVEDGGTLVVKMLDGQSRFSNERFTIEGTGDAAYGAAIYQIVSNDRFKLFKYLTLSDDATIYAGTHLGVDGTLEMNGHTLTVKGANFTLRNLSTPAPVGDLVTETRLVFGDTGSGSIGCSTNTLTAQNGGRLSFQNAAQTILWQVVVGNGGSIAGHENDTTLALDSAELAVQANPATGALSVRDKRTGVEWQTVLAPAAIAPSFTNAPRFTLSGAELVVEADFSELHSAGSVFPAPLAPNPGDALVIPMSEGFRIPFGECDLLKGGELGAWNGSSLSMPFFGVVDAADECGFMVIFETPEDAKVKFFADSSDFGVGAVAPLWVPECGSPGYTRRARFFFFADGGYVAMAKRYRAYAAAQGLVKTFREKAVERPLVERLPGAANIWYFPSSGEPTHAAMASELRESGIDRFLWSWNSEPRPSDLAAIAAMPNTLAGRYDVCRDVYFPDLLDALGRENPPSSEICNNTSAWPNDIAWDSADPTDWRRGWAVTGTNGATYHCAVQCDIPAIARLRQLAGGDLTNNPYTARFIDVTAAKGWEECYNPAHPMTRRVSRNAKIALLEMLCEEFGIVVGSEQGMDAFVPVCDYFEGMLSPTAARMPARRDGYGRSIRFRDDGGIPSQLSAKEWAKMERYAMNERYRIPLFELVYHDCVASHWYWYDYSNCPVYYWWKRDIFNALYGTAPMYIFDYQMWSERKAEFLASWRRVGGIARRTGFSEMLSHRALTADRSVQETRFADGTVVTVDFNAGTVEAGDYTVNVPEGQTRTIDAALVAELGQSDLVKTGRGTLVSSNVMSNYTGTIIVREGAFEIRTTSDLGTADGGTVVEDGGTLVVNMSSGQERFGNEHFTIAGTGDAAYGAAIYQRISNDRFKLFKYLTLSGDATIYAGTRLGVDYGTLAMNGYTLTVKGANFYLRDVTYASPIGNFVAEANVAFVRNQTATADATKTLTVRNGGRIGFAEAYVTPSFWTLVVEDGGHVASSATSTYTWKGDVVWNATSSGSASGLLVLDSRLTGTGIVWMTSGTLTLDRPPLSTVGLAVSGTATVRMAESVKPGDYTYRHGGMMTGYRADGWEGGYNTDRADTRWSYCAYGPGPQLTRDGYWDENDDHAYGNEIRARMWCSRGYIWNRAATNVTYTIFVGCVYQTYVYIDGTQVYNNKRDTWGNTYSFELPAGTCKSIDIRTTDGKVYGGPRSDADKFKINGVVANDPTGWFFTTNAVSEVESPATVATLALAGGGAIDMRGLPLAAGALSGAGLVTNAAALTVADSWTLSAADIMSGARLAVDGDLVFGDGCVLSVTNLRSLPVSETYTVCTADSITGFTSGTTISVGPCAWKFILSDDGRSITMKNASRNTMLCIR